MMLRTIAAVCLSSAAGLLSIAAMAGGTSREPLEFDVRFDSSLEPVDAEAFGVFLCRVGVSDDQALAIIQGLEEFLREIVRREDEFVVRRIGEDHEPREFVEAALQYATDRGVLRDTRRRRVQEFMQGPAMEYLTEEQAARWVSWRGTVLFDGGAWEQFEGFDLGLSFVPIDLVALETIRSEEGLELAGTILASSLSSRLNLLSRVADRNGGIEAALRRTSLESGIPWDKSGEQARRLFVAAASMNESVWSDQKAISAGLVSSLERLDFDGLCLAHSSDNLSSAGSIMRFCARLARDGQLGAETEGPLLTRLEALRRECHAFLEIAMEGGRLGEAAVDKGWQDRWAAQREAAMQARRGVTSYLLELGIPREEVRKGLVAYAPAASGRQRRRVNAEGQHHQMLRVSLGLEEFAAGVLGCSVEQWELIRTRAAGGGAIGHREEQVLDALSAARDLEVAATLHRGGADEGARVPWWSLSMVKLLAMKGGESSLDVLGVAARADRERAAALGTGDVALAGKITERVLRDLEETMASDASDELLFHFDMQVIPEVVRAEERLIGLIDLVGASPELKSLMRSRSHSVRSAARQAEDWVVDDGRPVPLIRDDSVMKRYLVAVRNLRHVAWGVEVLMARVESCED